MKSYPYRVYYPSTYNAENEKRWPLLFFLHGAGERGNNLSILNRQGLPKYLNAQENFPFVVAAPQCPLRSYWDIHTLNNCLTEVLTEVKADPARIYLSGMSMGGYGTWQWAATCPEKFAAILPVCGGGDPNLAKTLIETPIWAFHGEKDNIVPVEETIHMVEAVKKAGGNAKLTLYPDLTHDSWTTTYNNPEIYDWLLEYKK